MIEFLTWRRGPKYSRTDYIHSEGVCCKEDGHDECVVDVDYTLRMAYGVIINSECSFTPLGWCKVCDGLKYDCVFCHTAEELLNVENSQRVRALQAMIDAFHPNELPNEYQTVALGVIHG